jgi:hypothetical protein
MAGKAFLPYRSKAFLPYRSKAFLPYRAAAPSSTTIAVLARSSLALSCHATFVAFLARSCLRHVRAWVPALSRALRSLASLARAKRDDARIFL